MSLNTKLHLSNLIGQVEKLLVHWFHSKHIRLAHLRSLIETNQIIHDCELQYYGEVHQWNTHLLYNVDIIAQWHMTVSTIIIDFCRLNKDVSSSFIISYMLINRLPFTHQCSINCRLQIYAFHNYRFTYKHTSEQYSPWHPVAAISSQQSPRS